MLDGHQETVLTEALELSDSSWEVNGSWTLDIALAEDTWYAWQVRAVDSGGLESEWSVPQSFHYSLDNEAPYDVVMLRPIAERDRLRKRSFHLFISHVWKCAEVKAPPAWLHA